MTTRDGRPPIAAGSGKSPPNPWYILLVAILLPGVGQVLNDTPQRGFMFVFFILSFGWVTMHLAPADASFIGRHAGGIFVYAISVLDAYRWARYRWVLDRRRSGDGATAT